MQIAKNIKIKCDVSAANTAKIIELLEEQFSSVASGVEADDNKITVTALRAGLSNMHNTTAVISLKEAKDGKSYSVSVNADYKLSVVFWISTAISVLLFLPLLLADVGIVFYNKGQVEKNIDAQLKAVADDID